MPVAEDIKSSWADEVELEGGDLPPPTEVLENDLKIITEYKLNEDDKKVKIVRTYKIEKRIVPKSIALRKSLPKFGESVNDKPGPDPATTIVGEDVYMQYITSKEEGIRPEEDGIDKLKTLGDKAMFKCRHCSGDHWSKYCPWKDTVLVGGKIPETEKKPVVANTQVDSNKQAGTSKYVPPSLRVDSSGKRADSSSLSTARRDETLAIRLSNLSISTTEADLDDLVKQFGPVQKMFLAKDKITGMCKGFAYVHFKFHTDAVKAISTLNGHGYDHLIITVEWSKPQTNTNQ